ncbi:MAG: L-iditol 2-dehydrogenase, partial [Akkermansiaceae bacterium]
ALLSSGQLDVRPIIGGVWGFSNWHEAFEKMHSGKVVKSLLRPD